MNSQYNNLVLRLVKFASTSGVSTGVDYTLFFFLTYLGWPIQTSHFCSYAFASLLNFLLQKKYIFNLKRKLQHAFVMALLFSFCSLLLGTVLIYRLSLVPWWSEDPLFPKVITTGTLFFFNFFARRFAFEGFKKISG